MWDFQCPSQTLACKEYTFPQFLSPLCVCLRSLPVTRHYGQIQLASHWFPLRRSIANQVKVIINSTLSTVLGFKLLLGGDTAFSVRKEAPETIRQPHWAEMARVKVLIKLLYSCKSTKTQFVSCTSIRSYQFFTHKYIYIYKYIIRI